MTTLANEYRDIMGETMETFRLMSGMDHAAKSKTAQRLAKVIRSEADVVGEAGRPNWHDTIEQLACKKDIHPLQAWMLGELVATAVVSMHELANVEPISDDQLLRFTEELVFTARQHT